MGIFKEQEIEQEDALLLSSFEDGGYEPDEYTLVLPGLDSDVSRHMSIESADSFIRF